MVANIYWVLTISDPFYINYVISYNDPLLLLLFMTLFANKTLTHKKIKVTSQGQAGILFQSPLHLGLYCIWQN